MTFHSDRQCVDNCSMDKRSLSKLCYLLMTHGKLKGNINMSINELVISFLHIIAHNMKNRVLKYQTARSGETVNRQFHLALNYVLRLHNILLKKPEPIPKNCTGERRKWFKDAALVDCLVELSKDSAWKSENGFRTGYLVHLEKLMAVKLPSNSLKAIPHIESRYKLLKRQFYAINEMLNHSSGFGWNDVTKSNAETPVDVVEEINLYDEKVDTFNIETPAQCYKDEESNNVNQAIRKSETPDSSICPSNKKLTTRKRKGKADDVLGDLVGEIHKYVIAVNEANEEMKGLSTYFKK
ncbi:hypothetical protein ZIOFF_050241 [Zingiber officinale]|uniref:DUF8040 domain-containing protein n=1 Tax=Zingiber officinale TaxID=94328 RepID=A0A8J5FJY5_ZINOF|nr:hypothetical protein ZIOFF_050241 [Zingiber officinale]